MTSASSPPRREPVVGVIAAAVIACAAGWMAPAAGRTITIEDFAVEVAVDESGGFDVTETLRLQFTGQWNGVIRTVPVQNVTSRGERRNLGFRLKSVTDDAGGRLEVKQGRRGADVDLRISVPGAVDAVRTVVIRYRITGGLRFFDDHDELYWNATGDEWTFPILAARARITLPRAVVNVRANAFTGAYGTRERAVRIVVDGAVQGPDDAFTAAGESPPPAGAEHVIEIEATRPLGIREGLTAAVAWNPGVVRRPSAWARLVAGWLSWFAGRSLPTALVAGPLLAFLGMFGVWWFRGRDPRPGPLVVEYEPPDGLGPAEVGTLVDNQPDKRDLVAGLVDAAVKGALRIREISPRGWFTRPAYAFDLTAPEEAWEPAGIAASGRSMLRGMFPTRTGAPSADGVIATVTSAELENSFHYRLKSIKTAIFRELLERGLYRSRPDRVVNGYAFAALACGILAGIVAVWAAPKGGRPDDMLTIGGPMAAAVVTGLIVGLFAVVMPTRTVAGARARDRIRGLQEFLTRVESHRLESLPLTPGLFERLLPYAIALGVERRWARAFEGICTNAPGWFVGTTVGDGVHFDVGGFTDRIDLMGNTTAAAMTSAPRSSGDSGFGGGGGGDWGGGGGGGGGFSGGGDGGGGGSGW